LITTNKIIGQKIRAFRKQKKLSQYDLADILYKSQSSISEMEHGRQGIFAKDLFDIAGALGINLYDFERRQSS